MRRRRHPERRPDREHRDDDRNDDGGTCGDPPAHLALAGPVLDPRNETVGRHVAALDVREPAAQGVLEATHRCFRPVRGVA